MLMNRATWLSPQPLNKFKPENIFLAFMLFVLTSCGGGGGSGSADSTAPTVSAGNPTAGQTGVDKDATVTAIFSESMNASTINSSTVTVNSNGSPVSGSVSYSGITATFTPSSRLSPNTVYTVTVTTAAQDLAGNSMASDESWRFTTETTYTVQVSWNANPETAVNRAGGGYKIHHSTSSGFKPGDADVTEVNVPYTSGALAPTLVNLELEPGTYYIRLAAYSALNSPWSSGGSMSTASSQITRTVP
jgi:hypothetical protein